MSIPTARLKEAPIAGLASLITEKVGEIANEKNRREELLLQLTGSVIAAFVNGGRVQAGELPALISSVHATFAQLGGRPSFAVQAAPAERPRPAVDPKKSVQDDFIVCLEDGLKFKSLKRHLAGLGMTPEEYRTKWGLPASYPMVAPAYAARRSALAKASGLGKSRRGATVN